MTLKKLKEEARGNNLTCQYCRGEVCNEKRKTVKEWNRCPWHRADWETETSIFYWIIDILTFGIAKHLIFRHKLKKFKKLCQ